MRQHGGTIHSIACVGGAESVDYTSGSTEGCDDADDADEDDDYFPALSQFDVERHLADRQQQQQLDTDVEMTRLAIVTRECAVFMADFTQKIFDQS